MTLKDNESAQIVNAIILQHLKNNSFTKQDIDKIISDLQNKINSDFLLANYDLIPPNED